MTPPLLSVQHLSIGFDPLHPAGAVKDISFEVHKGEIVAIVGESGSGKSVSSLSLMQLLPSKAQVSGKALFNGQDNEPVDLLHLPDKKINHIRGKSISMIFQEPMTSLNPVFTCGYQVMESLQLHQHLSSAQARQKTIDLFEKVKLPNPAAMLKRYPHQLSGGQKQRVMIAMAISCDPSLLIADEPTTALDVTVQKTILDLIKEIQQTSGMAVIFITHDLGLVADIADRVLVMYHGDIVEQGNTDDILQHPQHPYTRALMACRPALHPRGSRLPVVSDFLNTGASVNPILSQPSSKTPPTLLVADQRETVLRVKDLTVEFDAKETLFGKRIPGTRAVDNVSFSIAKGETVGLVGESGCGKTTLGRALLQLLPATSGSMILNGTELRGLSGKALQPIRKDLQIVFQDPYGSLNPRLTIGAAIAEPMQLHGIAPDKKFRREKVIELLEKVNLKAEHFNFYPHQFSGGQRQRICIARALALNPSFLIFDESVSALDVSVQAQVLNLLNDLKREFGFTAIFISHDLSVVRFICDRMLVMNKGKIIEEGPADDIYFSPKNEYTQNLIAAIPGKKLTV